MPPRRERGPRPQGPLFWDRKPLLSPYRARRAGRSAHRTLAPSPSSAAQRIQDSGPRGREHGKARPAASVAEPESIALSSLLGRPTLPGPQPQLRRGAEAGRSPRCAGSRPPTARQRSPPPPRTRPCIAGTARSPSNRPQERPKSRQRGWPPTGAGTVAAPSGNWCASSSSRAAPPPLLLPAEHTHHELSERHTMVS